MTEGTTAGFFSANELLRAARDVLLSCGYTELFSDEGEPTDGARTFENAYNYVMVVAFETWRDLRGSWTSYQAIAAEAMTKRVKRDDPKAWDGYLVLLTTSPIPLEQGAVANDIRSDVSRLRKLLGTGEDIRNLSDVKKTLLPLLPMSPVAGFVGETSGLDALARILERHGIPGGATEEIVKAFKAQEPLLPKLHEFRTKQ